MGNDTKDTKEIFKRLRSKRYLEGFGDKILPKGVFNYLIKEKLGLEPDEYIIIDSQHEGKPLPEGYEENSGGVLTKDGKIYDFWTNWDSEKVAPNGQKGYYTLGDNKFLPKEWGGRSFFHEISLKSEDYQKYIKNLKKKAS